jgi:hypothetical protein
LECLRAKETKKRWKIFNDTHPQYPPPQKGGNQRPSKQIKCPQKIEDKTTSAQPFKFIPDRPTLEFGPSVPHQNAFNDAPTPMEEENTKEDDLLGEDLVNYGASPEDPCMDVNVIMFSADCTIISDDEPVVAQFNFGPKEAAFTKPKESDNHLNLLFVRCHVDGILIAKMLVDGGATENLM